MVPGWPYSFVVALESGRSSWTAPLDAVRLAPGDDAATVTAAQLRDVVGWAESAGHWQLGGQRSWWWPTPATTAPAAWFAARLLYRCCPDALDRDLRRAVTPRVPGAHGAEFVSATHDCRGVR